MPYKVYHTNGKNITKESVDNWIHDYMVLDVETTGTEPTKNEIIEVAASHFINGNEVSVFQSLVRPTKRYSAKEILEPFIVNLTHITDAMIHNAELPENIIPAFKEFLGDHVIIGHNIPFDLDFLNENFQKYCNSTCNNNYVDTLEIARQCYVFDNYKLETLIKEFNIEIQNEHRALEDERAEFQLLQTMLPDFMKMNPDLQHPDLDYPYTLI